MKRVVTIAETKAVDAYVNCKKGKSVPSDAVIGFLKKNHVTGKTEKEIDALITSAKKLKDGTILGEGDKFREWCEGCGRTLPDDELVSFMNRDPFEAIMHVRKTIPTDPGMWRSWCSYRAGKGRHRV